MWVCLKLNQNSSHLRVEPAGDGVTEEDKVRYNPSRVHADHLTHPPERGVLLVVVSDVPEWEENVRESQQKCCNPQTFLCGTSLKWLPPLPETSAPRPHKLLKTWSNNAGTDEAHPANRDRRVFQQSFRSVWPEDFLMVGQMQRCNGVDNLLMMVIRGLRMAGM